MAEELKLSGKTVQCPVCTKNTALEEQIQEITSLLCVSCGYTTNSTFTENTKEFDNTPKMILSLKFWDSQRQLYWIPVVINMPSRGFIYPEKHGKKMIWTYVPMVDIPKEQQKDYPIPNQDGKFYDKKLDVNASMKFTNFYESLKAIGAVIELDDLQENVKDGEQ